MAHGSYLVRNVPLEEQVQLLSFLNAINKKFDNDSLEKRIELQKLVYLGQKYGLNFEYAFKWHFHGPYSTILADVGYAIDKNEYGQLSARAQEFDLRKISADPAKLERFKRMVEPYLNDVVSLEIAGSLVWVREQYYPNIPIERCRDSLVRDVAYVYKKFEPCKVIDVLRRLEQFGIIS